MPVIYVNEPYPPRIAFGAQRRAGWSTTVVMVDSGLADTEERWEHARHAFDVSFAVRTAEDYTVIEQHFHMVRARARRFPFPDPLDRAVTQDRGLLLPVDDPVAPTLWQLAKRYGSGGNAWNRLITRPLAGAIIYRTRAGVTASITGSATVSLENGGVTIAPGTLIPGDTLSWSGAFAVPCRYDVEELPAVIVNKQPGPDGEFWVTVSSIPIVEDKELGALGEWLSSPSSS